MYARIIIIIIYLFLDLVLYCCKMSANLFISYLIPVHEVNMCPSSPLAVPLLMLA